jgi:arylformamidase
MNKSALDLIDLTHTFTPDMPVYPGDPCAKLYQCAHIEENGLLNKYNIETNMHVGTHMDAPLHMVEDGAFICDFPVEKFQGRGVLIDARGQNPIDTNLLKGKNIKEGDIVLLWTGWDKKFRTDEYFKSWPAITEEFARALVERKIALIGMDMPGPDQDAPFPIHKIFLKAEILIIENMAGLDALEGKSFLIHAYPVKYEADAAPVRVVAEVTDERSTRI